MKNKLALQKSAQLEAMKLPKFNGAGDNRYLKFKQLDDDFQELVMKKEYSDNEKLRFLRQYCEGDALELIKITIRVINWIWHIKSS